MKQRALFFTICFCVVSGQGYAASKSFQNCWVEAGKTYGVSPNLLYAIAQVESDLRSDLVTDEARNSISIGLMQINTFWFKKLEGFGITQEMLFDPCTNIKVGAWILAQEIVRYGNTWTAVGAYNGGAYNKKSKQTKISRYNVYARKVYNRLYTGHRKLGKDDFLINDN